MEKLNYLKESVQEDLYDFFKKMELTEKEFQKLNEVAKEEGIIFLSTPFSFEAAEFLDKLGVPAFKIASRDLPHFPFLEFLAKKKKPMILSTGLANIGEVSEAVEKIKSAGNDKIILLQCTSTYPPEDREINLRVIQTYNKIFDCISGFSDHSVGIEIPFAAVALGAKVIEKHFTLDKKMEGPDHRISADPVEFSFLVRGIRRIEEALGSFNKIPTPSEVKARKLGRRSIVAKKDIKKGEIIKREFLDFKPPNLGIEPRDINLVVGQKATKNIKEGEIITWDKIY
jgi:sialic acid synthase SpsE